MNAYLSNSLSWSLKWWWYVWFCLAPAISLFLSFIPDGSCSRPIPWHILYVCIHTTSAHGIYWYKSSWRYLYRPQFRLRRSGDAGIFWRDVEPICRERRPTGRRWWSLRRYSALLWRCRIYSKNVGIFWRDVGLICRERRLTQRR